MARALIVEISEAARTLWAAWAPAFVAAAFFWGVSASILWVSGLL